MEVVWFGHSFFKFVFKNSQDEKVVLVIDPFDESIGLKVPKTEADILLCTHSHYDHHNLKAITNNPFLIEEPGEYEVKGVYIKGISSFHDNSRGGERGVNTIFKFEAENIKVCHLGDIGQKELSGEQVEAIGEVDILLVPVGGVYTVDGKEAASIVSQIEPRIVIPMHYKLPKLKLDIEGPEKFLKTMGVDNPEVKKKLNITPKNLPTEETKIVMMSVS